MAVCTARNSENDKNKQTCYGKSTVIFRATIPVGIDSTHPFPSLFSSCQKKAIDLIIYRQKMTSSTTYIQKQVNSNYVYIIPGSTNPPRSCLVLVRACSQFSLRWLFQDHPILSSDHSTAMCMCMCIGMCKFICTCCMHIHRQLIAYVVQMNTAEG